MEVNVGDSVEAVDQLGTWAKAKVVCKADNSVVVNFPPQKAEQDREICDPSEIREETPEETLIPRCFSHKKVRATDHDVIADAGTHGLDDLFCLLFSHKKSNLFPNFFALRT